jgi:two-component system cell cycle sensor histidine kinase/response regulator CckA
MKRDIDHLSKPELRQQAEDFLNKNPAAIQSTPAADIQKLVEELRIHQVELEMQNEELRRAQLELAEARDRYIDLYDFAPIGYITISETGFILGVNLTGAKMLGIERGRLVGQPFSSFVTGDAQDNYYLYRKELFETGTRQTCELSLKKKEGSIFQAHLESIAVKETGTDGSCIRATISDISRRRQAQQEKANLKAQLQHAQKMEAVGTLAGGIAHDFNNLLQAVQGFSEILLFDKHKKDPGYNELQQISHAAKRGAELTRQLLTFSRKIESKLRLVDLNVLVEKTNILLERTLPRMIAIKLRLVPQGMVVNGDPAQIEQILMNLAVNAKDAMPEGGELTIQTAITQLDEVYCRILPETKPGLYVQLTVSDNGCGMDEKTLKKIFDPFYTTKGLAEGTGLGLAMVYGIVKSHGGHIECVSGLGLGTSFKIYFPALDGEPLAEKTTREERPGGGSETILLVDDDEIVRDVGEATLTRFGYTVRTAADGNMALERYRREHQRIDLVILDLVMPKMSGKKCLEALIKINPAAKVIIASGYSESEHRAGLIQSGAKGFVGKPYAANKLLSVIREVLEKE